MAPADHRPAFGRGVLRAAVGARQRHADGSADRPRAGIWFCTIPPALREARAAAMGIALISSVAQLGGLSGPAVVGWIFQRTGSIYTGYAIAATAMLIGTLLATFAIPHTRLRKPGEGTAGLGSP